MNPTNIQQNSKGGIHLGALIEAPGQKISGKFSCGGYAHTVPQSTNAAAMVDEWHTTHSPRASNVAKAS